jgi:hypothetical protein
MASSLVLVAGCGKGAPMAAVVNGEPITMEQFNKYLMVKPQVQVVVVPARLQAGSGGQLPQQPYNGAVVGSLGLQALNDLIQQAVLKQFARDEKVYPSDADVAAELEDRKKTNPNFVKDLINAGFTTPMIESDLAMQLAQYNLTTKGISVSPEEVTTYIKEHPKEFVVPEGIEMVWMLVPDDKKKAADADLKAGNSFLMVAQTYTIAPNARAMQYRFPEQYMPQLANYGPELLPAIQKTAPQEQTNWIKFTEGWAKFYVNKKTPERALPIDDAMRKKVLRAIALQKGALAKDMNLRIQERLKTAKIEIVIDSLRDPWKRSIESLQAVSGGTTTGSTTGSTAGTP